jgi:hypothetical protein
MRVTSAGVSVQTFFCTFRVAIACPFKIRGRLPAILEQIFACVPALKQTVQVRRDIVSVRALYDRCVHPHHRQTGSIKGRVILPYLLFDAAVLAARRTYCEIRSRRRAPRDSPLDFAMADNCAMCSGTQSKVVNTKSDVIGCIPRIQIDSLV